MDEREERLIRNEALFRQVNERMRELGESFHLVADHGEFVCECSDVHCTERIALALTEYERIRAQPGRFVLLPGHESPEVERVVERHEGWIVTHKSPEDLAEADVDLDPRDGEA